VVGVLGAVVLGCAVVAWVGVVMTHTTVVAGAPAHHPAAHHAAEQLTVQTVGLGLGVGRWMAGWALMVVAMMLPPALPLLRAMDKLTAGRADRGGLIATVVTAFLAVWIVAGAVLYAVGTGLNAALTLLPPGAKNVGLFAGVAAIVAGAYQFTPLKKACLDNCRTPTSVIMVRWQATTPHRSSAHIGVVYGAICVGCCWALMLLSVLVGALLLPIMVVVAGFMVLERLLPKVRPLIPLQAGLAVVVGVLLIAGQLPSGFS
jgi:predicted metal-binding membrane protein